VQATTRSATAGAVARHAAPRGPFPLISDRIEFGSTGLNQLEPAFGTVIIPSRDGSYILNLLEAGWQGWQLLHG